MVNLAHSKLADDEYAAYYGGYIRLVPDGDIIENLERQASETLALLRGITEQHGGFRYASGKWSIKEVVGHVTDTERVFAYRALCFARGDRTPLPGFEQDDYVIHAASDNYALEDLAAEFECVRRSTVFLFRHLDADAWLRRGTASENQVSVRALAHIIAGHELHHRRILHERYMLDGNI